MKPTRMYLVVLVALMFVAGPLAAPASAAKYDARTSISASRATCEVTGSLTWRMEETTEASVAIFETYPSYVQIGDREYALSASRGQVTVTRPGVSGRTYEAVGRVYGSPGKNPVASRVITLTCAS